jgi:hypothetical protein
MSKLKAVGKKGKETETETEQSQQKAIAVIAAGNMLMLQPNFDIPAGSVVRVDPTVSGVQIVGGESAAPSEDTTPAA